MIDRDQLLAQFGGNVLLRRGNLILRRELEGTREETLATGIPSGTRILLSPGYAYVAPRLYAARSDASVPLVVPTPPLAIDSRGCALVPATREPDGQPAVPCTGIAVSRRRSAVSRRRSAVSRQRSET
ncbi:MAG: hypothetical protein QM784_40645 [Polyangiaceae bacterium]